MPGPADDGYYAGSAGIPHDEAMDDEDDALELTMEVEEPAAEESAADTEQPAADVASGSMQDELLLGDDTATEEDLRPGPSTAQRRSRMLRGAANEDGAEPPGRAAAPASSTLFERMANMSRSAPAAAEDEQPESASGLRIPRFLGRQNNQ